jgi:prevent-host-death family protein
MAKKRRVGIRELKNRTSRIVDEVRETDEPYIVTKRGEPVAVLRPWSTADARAERVERARRGLALLDDLAPRVARTAGRRSAVAAVSGQRR